MNVADMNPRTCLVQNIYGLVRQMPVAHIANTQIYTCFYCFRRINYVVVLFILVANIVQNLHTLFGCCWFNHNHLKTTLQGTVFFNILAIFIQGSSSYTLNFASGQSRLEHIAGIQRTAGTTGTYNGMYFINEEDNIIGFFQFHHQGLHSLFKLATVFGSGHHAGNIKAHYTLIEQHTANFTLYNAQGKAFGYGGLTHTGFSD